MAVFLKSIATIWADIIYRRAIVILIITALFTSFAFTHAVSINLSTDIDALMPEGAKSVQTLNKARMKTGSFASIQIVVQSNDSEASLDFIRSTKIAIDKYNWVGSSQYFEDIETLARHKLLLLSTEELLALERDINQAYPTLIAKEIAKATGTGTTVILREGNLSGSSTTDLDRTRIDDILGEVKTLQTKRQYFVSDDALTAVLIVWPKPGFTSLIDSKMMVKDAHTVIDTLIAAGGKPDIQAGVAGRIASQVIQFESIIGDLKIGLLSAIGLIAILLIWSYRSLLVIPIIFIPLIIGIIWTLGLTAMTIGGLNLITAFLILILFGLGIDFAIHNTSRYLEERRNGSAPETAIIVIMTETGSASFIAALTTSAGFFALMLTEFRAFKEFGFIAGSGILLTFIAMYSVLPALLTVMERLGHKADKPLNSIHRTSYPKLSFNPLNSRRPILLICFGLCVFSIVFAPQIHFESNMKNLEAHMPGEHMAARHAVKKVIKTSNSRAIIVAENQAELVAIDRFFKDKIITDIETPTIRKITSILDFVPDQHSQKHRLEIIRRLKKRADDLQGLDPETYEAGRRYLSIDTLNIQDLPNSLRRSFVGTDRVPAYLVYIDNAVNLDDNRLARQFYDDVAQFTIDGKSYYAASESFILIEMLALMKGDALNAILLVIITTAFMVFLFTRTVKGTGIILIPPLIGIFLTAGIMGAFGPSLSIMNMVVLPSLIGISVDNSIHVFHRYKEEGANISKIMNTTGRAAILTTMTTLIGFGGMITASMGGLKSMAVLAIIGFLSCLLMTWVLLPILLNIYGEQSVRRQP